jgi:PleD family two-component response regulator
MPVRQAIFRSLCRRKWRDTALLFSYVSVNLFQDHTALKSRPCLAEKKNNGFPQGSWMATTKILLVDDDEILNQIMRSLLEREGFDVTVASSVAEALKLISSEPYDVLLSDLHMPGAADGLSVISAMRHLNPNAIASC